jgi:probable rRNA maturation factor
MSSDGSTVTFRGVPATLRRGAVAGFARRVAAEVTKGRTFDCLVTTDRELQRLNREFRGKDKTTDVLSFPVGPPLPNGRGSVSSLRHMGDIAVSLGRARAQAREFGHAVEREIQILMLHGVLHLMGMDHESDGGRMARAELRWRRKLGLPNGLIERVRA